MKMRRWFVLSMIFVLLSGLFSACQPIDGGEEQLEPVLKSAKIRVADPLLTPTEIEQLVDGNNAFALDLYQQVKDQNKNLIYSPFSISMALAMVYGGARTTTAEQMAQVMHISGSDAQLHTGYNWLDQELEKRALGPEGKKDSGFELSIANSIWGQTGHPFEPAYLDLLAENYGAGMRATDFAADAETGRKAINDWVSEETQNKINDLLPQGSVDANTRLVLANAIYFNAPWKDAFDKKETFDGIFTRLDDSQVTVPMMHAKKTYGFGVGIGYTAIEMPYRGGQVAMLIMMPNAGSFEKFENEISVELYNQIRQGLSYEEVTLSLPKYKIETALGLKETLVEMGMTDAFSDQAADFSGIDGTRSLVIKDVVHKAFIDVNEKGTEAAAATGIIVGVTSMREENIVVIDRPFLYAIYDKVTGSILFVGKVVDPSL